MDSATNRPPLPLLFQLYSPNNYSHSGAIMSTALVDDSSSVHTESVELRSRNAKTHITSSNDLLYRHESPTTGGANGGRAPLMEHVVKSGENLVQISLQYSVPVSEIKRVNNIVADHEIHGLPMLRVPVTRAFLLRRQMMEAAEEKGPREGQIIDLLGEEGTSSSNFETFDASEGKRTVHRNVSKEFGHRGQPNQQNAFKKSDLLNGQPDELYSFDESLSGHAKEAIEGILDETDRNMATIRQNLPSPSLEGGAFHFVDAGAPDHSSNVWLIVAVVLVIFVLLPLALTFLEESGELEEHHQQRPLQH
uniref:LysM domain-containing protein n=1 Tax=Globodera rostochiensis TaxID=31243 RepID=A0A914ICA6_GLORO